MKKFIKEDCSEKWSILDRYPDNPSGDGIFNLTLADMEIPIMPALQQAFAHKIHTSELNFQDLEKEAKQSIVDWYKRQHKVDLERGGKNHLNQIIVVSSIASLSAYCILALTKPEDKVMLLTPVFSHFIKSCKNLGRIPVTAPLVLSEKKDETTFQINFSEFEEKVKVCQLLVMLQPHNPSGKVWSQEEVSRISNICLKYGVIIFSDEILSDLYPIQKKDFDSGKMLTSFAGEFPKNQNIIVGNSISKAFNACAIQGGYALFGCATLANKVKKTVKQEIGDSVDPLALNYIPICLSDFGREWLRYVRGIILTNYNKLSKFVQKRLPLVKMVRLDASFLVYINFESYGPNFLEKLSENGIFVQSLAQYYEPALNQNKDLRMCIALEENQFVKFLEKMQIVSKHFYPGTKSKL